MITYSGRKCVLSFTKFLSFVIIVMFLVTVLLTFIVLTSENCACVNQQTSFCPNSYPKLKNRKLLSHNLAVLVPFRDRFDELLTFVPYMTNFLNAQGIQYSIFILNQVDNYRFNRASLINVGYLYTMGDYDYIAMHDVDLLPKNTNLSYAYPATQPFHVSAPNLHPRYHYDNFIGGILLVNREQFKLVNGMSNKYWGWGLEDDEFFVRLKDANLNVTRPVNITTGTSNTFRHTHNKTYRKRDTIKCYNQRNVTRRRDRQTGLHDVKYKITNVHKLTLDDYPVTVVNIELKCNRTVTPWCDCSNTTKSSLNKKT
ncbi:beta-1,4-galactosyltransferase 7 [Agrilus planipennis]|uniref:Beta-1,4-N-acetylgalactosaminyltransferase n=1 Tax=Agrilus planipennis TaxID=224129 RepID=A0A7F5R9J0_AGRPL|nr:beta-1,4-galactosyltransferase 7 [Agrilus planipennis]